MKDNIQYIPPGAFRALVPNAGNCNALIEATKDKTVGELLAKHLIQEQRDAIPQNCIWGLLKFFHFEFAQKGSWYLKPFFTDIVDLTERKIESLQHAPKGWVELRFKTAVCEKLENTII